jgi:hypothetical protein
MKAFNPVRFFCAAGIAVFLLLLPGSCGVLDEDIYGTDGAGPIPPAEPAAGPAQPVQAFNRGAILIRGNEWVAGLPGFPANAFSALYGEYRLEFSEAALSVGPDSAGAAPAGTDAGGTGAGNPRLEVRPFVDDPPDFYLWLSREGLYLPEDAWEARAGIPGYTVQQRDEEGSLLAASAIDGGTARDVWTVLFQFPPSTRTLLSTGETNLLIRTWISRFRYFLSLAAAPADVSLPAVVNF